MRGTAGARLAAAVVIVIALAVGGGWGAAATPPTDDGPTAAAYGAGWLADQLDAAGFVPDGNGDPAPSQTVGVALALAAAKTDGARFASALTWIEGHADAYITATGSDSAGALGYLLLLAAAGGVDPTDFGDIDLVARLDATLGAFTPGLYGADDPSFDGAVRQSLALLGLRAHGLTPPAAAVDWLTTQQCGTDSAPGTVGAWQAYRADVSVPCAAPDPSSFTGPDTNSTAFALQALAAVGVVPALDPLVPLAGWQDASGGFAFLAGLEVDPNSTALVLMALAAAGQDPTGAAWTKGGGNPLTSLLSWELGCDAAGADRGAFASPFSDGAPDLYATTQAVWGAAGHAFPWPTVASFADAPVPCEVVTPSTTVDAPSTTTASVPPAGTATSASPRFTG